MRALILSTLLLLGCGELINLEGDACDEGPDCVWPAVCCTEPRIPSLDGPVPLCESFRYCDAHLPFLIEGNPCNRTGSSFSACAEPWVCCAKTLLCATEEACEATPDPPEMTGSGAACHGDSDCAEGEICSGIDMRQRDGQCQSLSSLQPS